MNDIIKYSIENILHRKLRNWLTVISILIGIAAIFTLLSFGIGVHNYIGSISQKMGSDKITIQPKGFVSPGTSSIGFSDKDVNAIESVKGVKESVPIFITTSSIQYDKTKKGKLTYIMGIPLEREKLKILEETMNLDFDMGHNLRPNDKFKTVLGYDYKIKDKMFDKSLKVGGKVYIKNTVFKISGIYSPIGNPKDDCNVYIPITTAKQIFNDDNYQYVIAKVDNSKDINNVINNVEKELRKSRNQKEGQEDFVVQTFEDTLEAFSNIINILNVVLILIALISVVVSAVNIANSMYTSVLERTNEIGILKSIGAKNKYIMYIFLIESGLLGLVGGILGMTLGYIIAKIGGNYALNAGYGLLQPSFPLWLIILLLLFSFIIGLFSGLFPSRQASKLRPVDALRYE